jgi:putative intracellular protease/amidase
LGVSSYKATTLDWHRLPFWAQTTIIMKEKKIYLYVLDTLSDWEPGYAIAEINSGRMFKKGAPKCAVYTVGANKDTITTMGGIKIKPDLAVDDINHQDAGLLMLIGADSWDAPQHRDVLNLAQKFLQSEIPVAAICGATGALANAGTLNKYRHTSNDPSYLKQFPAYSGGDQYVMEPSVRDGNLITASGLAPLEFAREILSCLDVVEPAALQAWYNLYTTREAKYFYELSELSPQPQ